MSDTPLCPECKKKPVAPGRYLCASCEREIVAATEAEAQRMNRSFGRKHRKAKPAPAPMPEQTDRVAWGLFGRIKDPDKQISLEFERKIQRPRWMQYAFLASLLIIGLGCAWGAKVVADRSNTQVGKLKDVHDTVTGIAQSWHRLSEALN